MSNYGAQSKRSIKHQGCRFGKDSLATEDILSEYFCSKAFLF
jgi:hypothetical protein